ncbi:SdpI family protein [Brumimicrobium mesophilum]|uniref:SdpI family protein n=1 Tax=Brumimicrobium mesophilum TaxID=392717 RepID=UPI000D14288D|nr:SdpI family protein [Brumimicrobium mesophilum]
MYFENPLFVIPTLTGTIFVLVGIIILKFPPKKINSLYGYRTLSAMENKERWAFAQDYSAKKTVKFGALLTLTGLIGLVYYPNEIISMMLGLGLMTLAIIMIIFRTEKAIKIKFGKDKTSLK